MKRILLKLLCAVLCVCLLCSSLCGCSLLDRLMGDIKDRTEEPPKATHTLAETTDFYAEPDWDSPVVATYYAGSEVAYDETVQFDGAIWARTDSGWFVLEGSRPSPVEILDSYEVNTRVYATDSIPIYELPATYSEAIARAEPGVLLEISEIAETAEGTWGFAAVGWVNMRGVYEEGHIGAHYCFGVTREDSVAFCDLPGWQATEAVIVGSGMRLEILEQIFISGSWWGYTSDGWVCMDQVYEEGTLGKRNCTVMVIDKTPLNVRLAPGTDNEVLTTLRYGEYVQILEQVKRNGKYWGYTGMGWIYMDLTEIQ